jgi:hypothetical protein
VIGQVLAKQKKEKAKKENKPKKMNKKKNSSPITTHLRQKALSRNRTQLIKSRLSRRAGLPVSNTVRGVANVLLMCT